MEGFNTNEERQERVILVAVVLGDESETEDSMDELQALADTAGAVTAARVMQNRESVHPGTYIGKGKIEEVRQMLSQLPADSVICDDELSPAQMKNLSEQLGCKVLDRTLLILDIFAARAVTSEGKIQVELAQLGYSLSHLTGMGISMSRLGGGIGTRGPGEKKLEMDRRMIRNRMARLNSELKEIKLHRQVLRDGRNSSSLPSAAIVGYTNAGKSTLLNTLTQAGVLAENKLFATLDPTTRAMKMTDGQEILLTDTVGFIRKLPHQLIKAFRSTLEEALYADMIIHVADASNPQMEKQMHTVYETLRELGVQDKPIITLFNKADLLQPDHDPLRDPLADKVLCISAKTGEGLDLLETAIGEVLSQGLILIERLYSYEDAGKESLIRKYGKILELEYKPEGIQCHSVK